MLGAIVGDIIGSRFEFDNHRNTEFELFTPDCEFTDDTICTIAIADAIINGKSYKDALLEWCRKYPNPKGAYGGSFNRWIHSDNPQPYNSFGNGSAMRVSPCGWLYNDINAVRISAHKSAAITHNHPEGIKGAVCIAEMIYLARNGANKDDLALTATICGYGVADTLCKIRRTNVFNETCQVTVPQAIACFLGSMDFESAIRLAVSIGGDSDTIAAITGSIAEAYYGIPDNILSTALSYLPNDMLSVIERFKVRYVRQNNVYTTN